MLQVVQNYKTGILRLEEVPVPMLKDNGVLVRNCYSAISIGTEMMKVQTAKMSLLQKARSRPEDVKKIIQSIKQQGLLSTYKKVMNRLDTLTPLGYSAAGVVIKVGAGLDEFSVGDKVAIAGGGYANHAEINFVPKNLCIKIPQNVLLDEAAFSTIGAIAIQGIRQAKIQFGEVVAVIGMGLIGLITSKILLAIGNNVIGIDIDTFKTDFARKCGIENIAVFGKDEIKSLVMSMTNGFGVDAVLITTGTQNNTPVELAADIARDRARIVDIGITKIDLPRTAYYEKELEFIFSRSYGPGRYDANYEEKGIDYPIGYVRWTEKRNMESFLKLISAEKLNIGDLITHRYKFEDAEKVYKGIMSNEIKNTVGVIFEYEKSGPLDVLETKVTYKAQKDARPAVDKVIVGCIGAGNFAKTTLIPYLANNRNVILRGVATSSGISAKDAVVKFGFEYAASSAEDILEDESINTIIIATRHNLHSHFVIEGLKHKKNVFVEKPLAINENQLREIINIYQKAQDQSDSPFLMVGYNRRFAPVSIKLKEFFSLRNFPLLMHYRINAGLIPRMNWIQNLEEGGGRIIGEVCHFIDYMIFLTDSLPTKVFASSIKSDNKDIPSWDNVSINIVFQDGSIGNIIYTAIGDSIFPKEYIEIFGESSVGVIDNFSTLKLYKKQKKRTKRSFCNKGHSNEIEKFVQRINGGQGSPIQFDELIAVSQVTFGIHKSLEEGVPVDIKIV
ncbi:MAG: hypothetical protein A2173_00975 [Planctomycetes bacterium RBG_13_44_8b]|nr:MAG: hypothetical protein A2173_00975 [Planctomycetes bacterium RBG_13_44_8b]